MPKATELVSINVRIWTQMVSLRVCAPSYPASIVQTSAALESSGRVVKTKIFWLHLKRF